MIGEEWIVFNNCIVTKRQYKVKSPSGVVYDSRDWIAMNVKEDVRNHIIRVHNEVLNKEENGDW